MGAGFGVSPTTCWRYVNETVELLARRAPKLREALREAQRLGMAYVVIDGTLIPIDRIRSTPVSTRCTGCRPARR